MKHGNTVAALPVMDTYRIGESDRRPWGEYVITSLGANDLGEEYCEKIITIKSRKIMSLQSHKYRREIWTVSKGRLTALIDGCKFVLQENESITVPRRSIHCMANMDETPCIVLERQEGMCREEDIKRYLDIYGRKTQNSDRQDIQTNIELYRELVTDIKALAT